MEPSNCTDYDISLAEGATANQGKIKVCLNRFWGAVCDSYLDTTDANVLCRQLGFQSLGIYLLEKYHQYKFYTWSLCFLFLFFFCLFVFFLLCFFFFFFFLGAVVRRNYPYAEGDTFLVHGFRCSASATNISECSIQYFTNSHFCGHRNIAGVQCGKLSIPTLDLNIPALCPS